MGRLWQGVGVVSDGKGKRFDGTSTFHVIRYEDIPPDCLKETTSTSIVYKVLPQKKNHNCTFITIMVNCICYPGDTGTNTASLELVKLAINSVLSYRGTKISCFGIANFYLVTPLDHPKYVKIKLAEIPQEFIDEYNLTYNRWVYFEIRKVFYGFPQSGRLANDQLRTYLEKEGCYKTTNTPGLWRHKWHPILFSLIVEDFRIKNVEKFYADHLNLVLQKYHTITTNWVGKKYSGIDLAWNSTKFTCQITMENYIRYILTKYGHPMPTRPQLSPHNHIEINYGSKTQFVPDKDTSPHLDLAGIRRVQCIVGALLYYATIVCVKNFTTVAEGIKFMYMRLWWLICRKSQGQFILYWSPWASNKGY